MWVAEVSSIYSHLPGLTTSHKRLTLEVETAIEQKDARMHMFSLWMHDMLSSLHAAGMALVKSASSEKVCDADTSVHIAQAHVTQMTISMTKIQQSLGLYARCAALLKQLAYAPSKFRVKGECPPDDVEQVDSMSDEQLVEWLDHVSGLVSAQRELWEAVEVWQNSTRAWTAVSLKHLNTRDVERRAASLQRTLNTDAAPAGELCALVFQRLRRSRRHMLKLAKATIALRQPNMEPRHWKLVAQHLGVATVCWHPRERRRRSIVAQGESSSSDDDDVAGKRAPAGDSIAFTAAASRRKSKLHTVAAIDAEQARSALHLSLAQSTVVQVLELNVHTHADAFAAVRGAIWITVLFASAVLLNPCSFPRLPTWRQKRLSVQRS